MALQTNPPKDINVIATTTSWTWRVATFLRKANKEGEMLHTMCSLLYHTFKLYNNIHNAYHIRPRLPPSAKIIWPVMDGTKKDNKEEETAATRTTTRHGTAANRFLKL
jgi:hypothetical protein